MNENEQKRPYQMSKRAESAAQTERAIFSAVAELWCERPFAEITIDAVAERAAVSGRTILRRYGSKDGLFEACIKNDASDMKSDREKAQVGDIDGAIACLLEDYEAYGDAVIRTLAVEEQIDAAKSILHAGRAYHREWCAKIFEPFLPQSNDASYDEVLTSFVAASDIYLWKLLRRDLGQSLEQTKATFLRLVKGLLASD